MIEIRAFIEGRYPDFVLKHQCTSNILLRFLGLLSYEMRYQPFSRDYPQLQGFDFVQQTLRDSLAEQGLPVPTLYKHYAQALEPDGVCFKSFNVDPAFGDCVDSFVLADLTKLTPKKRKRYLGEGRDHGSIQT